MCIDGNVWRHSGQCENLHHSRLRLWCPVAACLILYGCAGPTGLRGPETTPGGAAAGDPKPFVPDCPSGFSAETDQRARSECGAKAGVTILSQSGSGSAICVNEAGSTYKCVGPKSFNEICVNGVQELTKTRITCYPPPPPIRPGGGAKCNPLEGCTNGYVCRERSRISLGASRTLAGPSTGQRGSLNSENRTFSVGGDCPAGTEREGSPRGDGSTNTTCAASWTSANAGDCRMSVTWSHGWGRWHCNIWYDVRETFHSSDGFFCEATPLAQ
jgi:hypothetical protein